MSDTTNSDNERQAPFRTRAEYLAWAKRQAQRRAAQERIGGEDPTGGTVRERPEEEEEQ